MDPTRFDTLISTLTASPSRRGALSTLGGLGLAGLLGPAEAKKKRKKKKKKANQGQATLCVNGLTLAVPQSVAPVLLSQGASDGACPPPPPPPFCAGKDYCAQGVSADCEASPPECSCRLRADPGHVGESFCCFLQSTGESNCDACEPDEVCVLIGGIFCSGGFGCCLPCPNPR